MAQQFWIRLCSTGGRVRGDFRETVRGCATAPSNQPLKTTILSHSYFIRIIIYALLMPTTIPFFSYIAHLYFRTRLISFSSHHSTTFGTYSYTDTLKNNPPGRTLRLGLRHSFWFVISFSLIQRTCELVIIRGNCFKSQPSSCWKQWWYDWKSLVLSISVV